jgi:hypothetical protein
MGEFILKALVKAKGLEGRYHIESAAVRKKTVFSPTFQSILPSNV